MIRLGVALLSLLSALPLAPGPPTRPDHPGGAAYAYSAARRAVPAVGGFGLAYYVPTPARGAASRYPVLVFGHGYGLYGGSITALGRPVDWYYAAFLRHLARKGYVVAFPQMQAGPFDGDRPAQAARYLDAVAWLAAHVPEADTARLVFAGHSMGADVALLAAGLAAREPRYRRFVPRDVLAMAPVDEAVLRPYLAALPSAVGVTLLTGDADTVVPPSNAVGIDRALRVRRHQVIELTSDTLVTPPLVADHNLSLSGGRVPGDLGGVPRVDALDWYGSWKLSVGLLDSDFRGGDPAWIWGARRLEGGVDGAGRALRYRALR